MLKRCIFVCTCIMIRIYIYIYNDRTSDKYKDRIITFIRRSRRRNFMEIIFREKKKEGKEKEQPNIPFVRTWFPDKNFPTGGGVREGGDF